VTWRELWIELARRHRGKELGTQARAFLLQSALVQRESERRNLSVPERAIEARLEMIRKQLRSQGLELRNYLGQMGLSVEQFRETTRSSLLANELVRQDLGLPSSAPVQEKDLSLWIDEMRKHYEIIEDPAKLEADVALRIDKTTIGLARLGEIMLRKLQVNDRQEILEQMVAYRLLDQKARKLEIRISQQDLDSELARRKAEIAANPSYARLGVDFAGLLQAQGRSVHDFVQGEVFRAQVYMRVLAAKLFPAERLDQELATRREHWLGRYGKTRQCYRLVILGSDAAAAQGGRSAKEALEIITGIAGQIHDEQDFIRAAQQWSDEASTRKTGGKLGWQPRITAQIPGVFMERAFELEIGKLSEPFAIRGGYALALVTAERPAPDEEQLRARIRRALMQAQVRSWLEASKLEFFSP
jgi:hypothetical protein